MATITAMCGGKSAFITIIVSEKEVEVSSITLNKSNATIFLNSNVKNVNLTATVNPSNATNKSVTWKSSNTSVAIVNNGVVTAKGIGSATITATAGGKSATCKITVSNKTFPVTSVTLDKISDAVYLNSGVSTVTLVATVNPSNATNKTITWSSNNSNVATVNNGVVTVKGLGSAVITASADGKSATYTINVKQKNIIVIGASQVVRMDNNVDSFTSAKGFSYNKNNNTLKFVSKGGTGIPYQYVGGEGWNNTLTFINNYNNLKLFIDFHIYFPLSGNEIKKMSCDQISSSNSSIKTFAQGYNNSIQNLKNQGYNVKAYVVSMHPVRTSEASSSQVVTNQNKNFCVAGYRSNFKYYEFNKAIKSVIENNYSSNLQYESLLIRIMNVNDEGKNFSFKWDYYHTTDGIHWDAKTSQLYAKEMLDYSGDV